MNEELLKYAIYFVGAILLLLFFLFIMALTKNVEPDETKKELNNKLGYLQERAKEYMKYSKVDSFNADSISRKLKRYGITYATKGKMTPILWVFTNFVIGFVIFLIGTSFNIIIGIIFGILGLFLLEVIFKISNDDDNNKMLDDIQRFFTILRTQTSAGVSLTTALTEAYVVVRNKRLKTALIELASRLLAHESVPSAINDFDEKFTNQYISSFCIVVRQSLQSGQSENVLGDLSNQITNIRKGIFLRTKANFERKTAFIQLAIFGGIITMIIVYMLFVMTEMGVY